MKTLYWRVYRKGKIVPAIKGYHTTDKEVYSEIVKDIQEDNNFNLMDFHSVVIEFT